MNELYAARNLCSSCRALVSKLTQYEAYLAVALLVKRHW